MTQVSYTSAFDRHNPGSKGGYVIAYRISDDNKTIEIAGSICSKGEVFDETVGQEKALARLDAKGLGYAVFDAAAALSGQMTDNAVSNSLTSLFGQIGINIAPTEQVNAGYDHLKEEMLNIMRPIASDLSNFNHKYLEMLIHAFFQKNLYRAIKPFVRKTKAQRTAEKQAAAAQAAQQAADEAASTEPQPEGTPA